MNEQHFYMAVNSKARELNMSPLLLISGIEGLYSFREVALNSINCPFLDNLILSILALRIGDSFHSIAEQNLKSANDEVRYAANVELKELSHEEIEHSANAYLQSFARVLAGKSAIRKYHEKALEVAALEVRKAQEQFKNASIGSIVLDICNDMREKVDFSFLFSK
jgi:hypothetical protein